MTAIVDSRVVGVAGRGTRTRQVRIGAEPPEAHGPPAKLSGCPKTLHVLWDEWQNGIGGNKPAREFTRRERGQEKVKHLYSKRKKFWFCVERMLSNGTTLVVAIRRIYDVYGYLSTTAILNKLAKDEGRWTCKTSELNRRRGGPTRRTRTTLRVSLGVVWKKGVSLIKWAWLYC